MAAARIVPQEELWWMRWWASEEALYVLDQAGETNEAAELQRKWRANLAADNPLQGPMPRALGGFEEALPFLEQTPPSLYSQLHHLPIWGNVRGDPRFHGLIRKLGCEAEYQVARETLARMLADLRAGR
jgi:hypothetical protein